MLHKWEPRRCILIITSAVCSALEWPQYVTHTDRPEFTQKPTYKGVFKEMSTKTNWATFALLSHPKPLLHTKERIVMSSAYTPTIAANIFETASKKSPIWFTAGFLCYFRCLEKWIPLSTEPIIVNFYLWTTMKYSLRNVISNKN